MNKIILVFCLAMMFACKTNNKQERNVDEQFITLTDSLTDALQKIHEQGLINGFSVAIVKDSAILYSKGFGQADIVAHRPYTKNTVQNIASISKTLIGISLLKAQELGKLKLDDPINNYLPFG